MAKHEKFYFATLGALREKIAAIGCDIELSEDLSPLRKTVKVGSRSAPNAIAMLPMEGCDCEPDGSPSELCERRYLRFGAGGAGLLWWEACAVVPEGRANPLQMMLTKQNIGKFSTLLKKANEAASDKNGTGHRPVNILQLTHSGRYSRPEGHKMMPLICQHDPLLDPRVGVYENDSVISDTYLESLPERYAETAMLAQEAGFDGVDIKTCHRYLLSELLACHTRNGKYGGSFENRTRLLREIISEVRRATANDFIVACRLNAYDAHPYPFGFGVKAQDDCMEYDSDEPMQLTKLLVKCGVQLLGSSAGNPYYIYPQVTRPFDSSVIGVPVPDEHPLESTARLFGFARDIQIAAGDIPVVGSGYSWLRGFAPNAGAANIVGGRCGFVGIGRLGFAYPDVPHDILNGGMDSNKACIACSKCTQIMRDHGRTGCVVRDSGVYASLYKEAREDAALRLQKS